jgi:DNA-binding NarL/FixJ family response regulator
MSSHDDLRSNRAGDGNGTGVPEGLNLSSDGELWLLVDEEAVPPAWVHRAMQVTVVRLSADEAKRLLSGDHARPTVAAEDEALAHLVASGVGVSEIAKRLHLTTRSIYRRLSRLRSTFGVETVGELAATLSRLGY